MASWPCQYYVLQSSIRHYYMKVVKDVAFITQLITRYKRSWNPIQQAQNKVGEHIILHQNKEYLQQPACLSQMEPYSRIHVLYLARSSWQTVLQTFSSAFFKSHISRAMFNSSTNTIEIAYHPAMHRWSSKWHIFFHMTSYAWLG